jgi:nuclear pore complex protein Nup160
MFLQGRRFTDGAGYKIQPFELAAMQARSYLVAINALALVDKRNAWVSVPARGTKVSGGHQSAWRYLMIQQSNKRKRTTSCIPEEEFSKGRQAIDIVTLDDIRAEYSLVLSKLQLSSQIQELAEHGESFIVPEIKSDSGIDISITPEETIGLLIQHGMFDLAQSSAVSLGVDMIPLFRSLAERCLLLHRHAQTTDPSSSAYLRSSPITSRLRGPPSTLALRYIQISLERHDNAKTNWKYSEEVAEVWFEKCVNKREGWVMPSWLVRREMKRDMEGWISRAIKWGWIEESLDWLIEWMREVCFDLSC